MVSRNQDSSRAGQKAATQARILEAAVALFAARGFERTSVSAIATRAGVSRAAVFWHFGDKATLFQEAFRTLLRPFVFEIKNTVQHLDPHKRFFELFVVYEQFVSRNRESIETIVRWMMESRTLREQLRKPLFSLHDEFAADLGRALEEALDGTEEAKPLAAAMVALLDGALVLSFLDSDAENQELRREGVRLIGNALLGEGTRT